MKLDRPAYAALIGLTGVAIVYVNLGPGAAVGLFLALLGNNLGQLKAQRVERREELEFAMKHLAERIDAVHEIKARAVIERIDALTEILRKIIRDG